MCAFLNFERIDLYQQKEKVLRITVLENLLECVFIFTS
ncbi:hypothetical protein HSIEG1_548 [Enterococcus sp. HSIEG1]|nr:hypothetical protein HSIEG1_548 [Enterococcus sp. HSIEG1]